MKTTLLHKFLSVFLLSYLLFFTGCGTTDVTGNKLPIADAGEDITVVQNEMFTFDGSRSYDEDGNIVSYEWYCAGFDISLYKGANNTLTMPAQRPIGEYNTTLIVTDDKNATAVDYVIVKIIAPTFQADAGSDLNVTENGSFTLDANKSYYKDGNIINYKWIYTDNNITLYDGPNAITPNLVANRAIGTYKIKLIVTNDKNQSLEDTLFLQIGNAPFEDIYSTGISVLQFKKFKDENKVYIDVRNPNEWADTGIIEGSYKITKPADINIWLQDGSDFLNIVTEKDQSFVLICAAGSRATTTANQLKDKGFTKVHYLIDGINGWRDAGEPTVSAN